MTSVKLSVINLFYYLLRVYRKRSIFELMTATDFFYHETHYTAKVTYTATCPAIIFVNLKLVFSKAVDKEYQIPNSVGKPTILANYQ